MVGWDEGEVRPVAVTTLGERYRRYRLSDPAAEEAMARSLRRYGQMAPVVVCLRGESAEVIDGFKRLSAARLLPLSTLSARLLAADERVAKAAIYGLNRGSRPTQELEEAWIVQALVRDDGLSQVETAELLGRHKSWVCRRLALLEKLAPEARQHLRLGLLSARLAREVVRLPAGNQAEVLQVARRDGLNASEVAGVVELWLRSASREQQEYVLAKPREALQQARGSPPLACDPRMSVAGNRLARQLAYLLDGLERMEHWLLHRGRAQLTATDQRLLTPSFTRLLRDALAVSELVEDLLKELPGHE
jgi:ParB-like chromosome segregation protein Spo0J